MSGPFGLRMGMRLEEIGIPLSENDYWYRFDRLPKGHSFFNTYSLHIPPNIGLVSIHAYRWYHGDDANDLHLLSEFRAVRDRYYMQYRDFETEDESIESGGIRLIKLSATWDASSISHLNTDLYRVRLEVERDDDDFGSISAFYTYNNFTEALNETKRRPYGTEDQYL